MTIRDVAERAGCGIATVSRVLNKSGSASLESRERVLKAAEDLGFQFNEFGRSLQSNRSHTLGVLVPSLINPVFAQAIEGIQEAAVRAGYQILLACANYDEEAELQNLATLIAKQVDGVILTVIDPDDSAALDLIEQRKLPYCLIFNQPAQSKRPAVGVDNIAAAARVGDELVELGHRAIAFVAVRFSTSDRSQQRYAGLNDALEKHGAAPARLLEVDYEPHNLEAALGDLFANNPQTSALFASNDMLALACMRALRALGKRVPEDVSIVGFDGISIGDMVQPSLATVATPGRDMGLEAAGRVIDALLNKGRPDGRTLTLPFQFRPGESLAAPGANRPTDELSLTRRISSPPHLTSIK